MRYKYTFLVPAYKAEFFEEALLSIAKQTCKNFKIIVSDDCSPENIKGIYDKLYSDIIGGAGLLKPTQLNYRCNKTNIGSVNLVYHWNQLVELCDTEYLIMASDDDLYSPQFLEEIDSLTNRYPSASLFCTRVRRINEYGDLTALDAPTLGFERQVDFLYGLYVLRRLKCIGNYVFKTSVLKGMGGFVDFPCAWGSDDITVSAMSKDGVGITPDCLFSFRMSGKNISSTTSLKVNSLKVKARMQNIDWFEHFSKDIATDGSVVANSRLAAYKEFYRTEWTKSIVAGSEFLAFKDMKNTYRWLVEHRKLNGVFLKCHFLWTWVRGGRARKK